MQKQSFLQEQKQQAFLLEYDFHQKQWQKYNYQPQLSPFQNIRNAFKSLTFNVLFDIRDTSIETYFPKEHLKYSKQRYLHIFEQIEALDPDVATFNEVTVGFVELLQQDKGAREKYLISMCVFDPASKHYLENMIIIKKTFNPFKVVRFCLKSHNFPVPIVYWKQGCQNSIVTVAVASIHLKSVTKNAPKRQVQLTQIVQYIKNSHKLLKSQNSEQNINKKYDHSQLIALLQGDMNFHSQEENVIVPKLGLRDCWLEMYDLQKAPGFTFDSLENFMIKELYWRYEKRRMRLDRMFVLSSVDEHQNMIKSQQQRNRLVVSQMKIVLNNPVYAEQAAQDGNKFPGWGALSFIGDYFGRNWFREKQKYLFPSDHFGLLADFQIRASTGQTILNTNLTKN